MKVSYINQNKSKDHIIFAINDWSKLTNNSIFTKNTISRKFGLFPKKFVLIKKNYEQIINIFFSFK